MMQMMTVVVVCQLCQRWPGKLCRLAHRTWSGALSEGTVLVFSDPLQMLGLFRLMHDVKKDSEPTPQERGKEAGERRSRKRGLQKGAQLQQTRDHTQM